MFEQKDPRRPVSGVMQPNTISTEQAPTNTVTHCLPVETYAVEYGDDSGRKHTTVFVKVGKDWYEANNSETWVGSLRPVLSKFTKQLDQLVAASKDKTVPKVDSVDPMEG